MNKALALFTASIMLVSAGYARPDTIKGKVVSLDGRPVAGAVVEVAGGTPRTESDAEGAFALEIAGSARVRIVVRHPAYYEESETVAPGASAGEPGHPPHPPHPAERGDRRHGAPLSRARLQDPGRADHPLLRAAERTDAAEHRRGHGRNPRAGPARLGRLLAGAFDSRPGPQPDPAPRRRLPHRQRPADRSRRLVRQPRGSRPDRNPAQPVLDLLRLGRHRRRRPDVHRRPAGRRRAYPDASTPDTAPSTASHPTGPSWAAAAARGASSFRSRAWMPTSTDPPWAKWPNRNTARSACSARSSTRPKPGGSD